ncbi:hypothetical protein [Lysobacter brunescens]|uniref:Transmembrane protein n=1 Tax=Lysobacter brunescens TaxID=262323 RepID=A0ABW2YBK9_9GAMM
MTPTPPANAPWKPPVWLIGLDVIAMVLLGLGLWMRFDPEGPLARSLPESARLAVLVVGGGLFAVCWALLMGSVLDHHRRRRRP